MSSLEITAVFFGIANMLLIIRRSVWNYPLALVMVSLYALIFWQTKLYSDAGLQVFFFVVNLLGWAAWYRHEAEDGEIIVSEMSPEDRTLWIIGSLAAVLAWGTVMHQLTDGSVPYLDAAVAMLSVAAQILMIRRKVESWHWWIVVNVISIGLYTYKHLYLTAGLYILLLILAVIGLNSWEGGTGMTTICFHGPESSGKSTLATMLAAHIGCEFVPEYGRAYCVDHGTNLSMAQLVEIAQTHDMMTRAARVRSNGLLVLDTDPLMTAVWADMMFGTRDPWFDAFSGVADVYLLPDIDLPWVDDGLRVYGGQDDRARFFALSRAELDRRQLDYAVVSGSGDARFDNTLAALRTLGIRI